MSMAGVRHYDHTHTPPHIINSLYSECSIQSRVLFLWAWTYNHKAMYGFLCCCDFSCLDELLRKIPSSQWVKKILQGIRGVQWTLHDKQTFVPSRKEHSGLDQTWDKQECYVLNHKEFDCLHTWEQALASKYRWAVALSLCCMMHSVESYKSGELKIEFIQTSQAECPQFTLLWWYQSNNQQFGSCGNNFSFINCFGWTHRIVFHKSKLTKIEFVLVRPNKLDVILLAKTRDIQALSLHLLDSNE